MDLQYGNALEMVPKLQGISFCFLDAEKGDYKEFYIQIIPLMIRGGLFLADNVISHYEMVKPMLEFVLNDPRVDAQIVPVGKGLLICRVT